MNKDKGQNKTKISVREEKQQMIKEYKFEGQKKNEGDRQKKDLSNFIQLQKTGDGRTSIVEKKQTGTETEKV